MSFVCCIDGLSILRATNSSSSLIFVVGQKDNTLLKRLVSAVDRLWDERLNIFIVLLCFFWEMGYLCFFFYFLLVFFFCSCFPFLAYWAEDL